MKSKQLKFANSSLNDIDFEIRPQSILKPISVFFLMPLILVIWALAIIFLIVSQRNLGNICYIFVPLVVVLVINSTTKIFRLCQRYNYDPLDILTDSRKPVLYLRSFANDSDEISERMDKKTSEELLTSVLREVGPVLTVGNPNDKKSKKTFLGATRIYIDENWEIEVEKLMSISKLIIIEASNSKSLLWEMKIAFEKIPPEKIIISFLSQHEFYLSGIQFGGNRQIFNLNNPFYQTFNNNFKKIFSYNLPEQTSELGFVYFDKNKQPFAVGIAYKERKFHYLYSSFIYSPISKYYISIKEIRGTIKFIFEKTELISK